VEFRAAINANMDNDGIAHWHCMDQGLQTLPNGEQVVHLSSRTRKSGIDLALAMRLVGDSPVQPEFWDVPGIPTLRVNLSARRGEVVGLTKFVAIATSRDTAKPVEMALEHVARPSGWDQALEAQQQAWGQEWERTDVTIEGDVEAQLAVRFSLFQLLIAAPRHDNRVNIGAKTLSGFGYRGHAFWDTEIFMLPLFTYTAPAIARNLLDYRYLTLDAARAKAREAGCQGAWFAWESADTGAEVTPTWVPDFNDRKKMARVWTGDLAIHISADIAYATHQYWRATGDDDWMAGRGAELMLETARFFASRAEWDAGQGAYMYNDVIGPDEYHDHVNNNAYTNLLARWNITTAIQLADWLKRNHPQQASALFNKLGLDDKQFQHWQDVAEKIRLHIRPDGLIEQFDNFFGLADINLEDYEPRNRSMHEIFGIEAANDYQVLKQPDVLMVQYLLRDAYSAESIRVNYDYYSPRTDHTYGSSLGPSIQAIIACLVNKPEDAYEHFMRAVRADLRDVRGNAGDGIHGASAGGVWQAVVFGFGGLRVRETGWTIQPHLPRHWKRITFRFFYRGQQQIVSVPAQ
jgi:trehalose/maltose hydrolase-like predicted phosphorylase